MQQQDVNVSARVAAVIKVAIRKSMGRMLGLRTVLAIKKRVSERMI